MNELGPQTIPSRKTLLAILYDWHNYYLLKDQQADIAYLLNWASKYQPKKILVIGAGTGRIACEFSQNYQKVIALDIALEKLQQMGNRCKKLPYRIVGDIRQFVPSHSFDLIIFPYSTFQLIPIIDQHIVLKNVGNILSVDGTIVIDVSSKFEARKSHGWQKFLAAYCEQLDLHVIEWQSQHTTKEYLDLYYRYETQFGRLAEHHERWFFHNRDLFNMHLINLSLRIRRIDKGYGKNTSPHRLIYHIASDGI